MGKILAPKAFAQAVVSHLHPTIHELTRKTWNKVAKKVLRHENFCKLGLLYDETDNRKGGWVAIYDPTTKNRETEYNTEADQIAHHASCTFGIKDAGNAVFVEFTDLKDFKAYYAVGTTDDKLKMKSAAKQEDNGRTSARVKKMSKIQSATAILDKMVGDNVALKEGIEQQRFNIRISQMIYEARTSAGLSQAQLAKKIGKKKSVIADLEDADFEGPALAMLQRIGEAFGKRLDLGWAKQHVSV